MSREPRVFTSESAAGGRGRCPLMPSYFLREIGYVSSAACAFMGRFRGITPEIQLGFKFPDLKERQSAAAAAKKAMLEKFRAAAQAPVVEVQREKRAAIHEARVVREAEREAAKKARQAESAAQAARAAELAAQAEGEAEAAKARAAAEEADRAAALEAEQKTARDERYAARKAAKKERRRGY